MEKKYGYFLGVLAFLIFGAFAASIGRACVRKKKIEGMTKAANEVIAGISRAVELPLLIR